MGSMRFDSDVRLRGNAKRRRDTTRFVMQLDDGRKWYWFRRMKKAEGIHVIIECWRLSEVR